MGGVTRRQIFAGAGALAVAAAIPDIVLGQGAGPILYGDGVHDDTAALQAFIDGKSVQFARPGMCWRREGPNGTLIHFDGGCFAVSSAIVISSGPTRLENLTIKQKGWKPRPNRSQFDFVGAAE